MDLRYKVKTAPIIFPVDLTKFKNNLHIPIENTDQDVYLQDILNAAIDDAQTMTGRQFCAATYTAYMDQCPDGNELEIDLGPVTAITAVKYYAPGAAIQTTFDALKYQLDNVDLTARLRLSEYFTADTNRMNSVEIEFTCGWATAAAVPQTIKDAIILLATERYLNPENAPGMSNRTNAAQRLLNKYKIQLY